MLRIPVKEIALILITLFTLPLTEVQGHKCFTCLYPAPLPSMKECPSPKEDNSMECSLTFGLDKSKSYDAYCYATYRTNPSSGALIKIERSCIYELKGSKTMEYGHAQNCDNATMFRREGHEDMNVFRCACPTDNCNSAFIKT